MSAKPTATAERLAALEVKAELHATLMDEVRLDVKSILSSSKNVEVHLAKVPTFADLQPMDARIVELEKEKERASGAWKVVCAIAAAAGAVAGLLADLFAGVFSSKN